MAENKLFLSAYYYSFDATGVREIDLILQAVAKAGKGYHNTEDWMDGGVVEPIQQAAKEAAAAWNCRPPPSTAGWLPISTAPKDGTTLLVFLPDKIIYPSGKRHADGSPFWKRKDARCMLARWTECPPDLENKLPGLRAKGLAVLKGGYWTARADGLRPLDRLPSHWMPLPPAPSQEGASEGEDTSGAVAPPFEKGRAAPTAEEFDANVDRLKACEHIADGDEGWEALRNLCPSTAAVARLRDRLASLLFALSGVRVIEWAPGGDEALLRAVKDAHAAIVPEQESSADERDGAVAKRSVARSESPSSEGGEEKT